MSWEMKKNQLFPSQRPFRHPLPVAGEPLLPDGADVLVGRQRGLLVIPDQFLPVVRITGPLQLRSLIGAERGQENAELVLELIAQGDRRALQIRRFKDKSLGGGGPELDVAIQNHSFGEVAVGGFVVSFHFNFREESWSLLLNENPRPVIQSSKRSRSYPGGLPCLKSRT